MKIERVHREILYNVLEKKSARFTQKSLSQRCGISLSTVNHALKPLIRMHAVEMHRRGFTVINPKKILVYWACIRNLEREVVYKTHVNENVERIETLLPPHSILTAYSAFKLRFKKVPAEYNEVIVYGRKEEFEKRFGKQEHKLPENLIVLKLDEHLLSFPSIPIAQIFVDLWNLKKWYANDFLKALEGEIDGILAELGYR